MPLTFADIIRLGLVTTPSGHQSVSGQSVQFETPITYAQLLRPSIAMLSDTSAIYNYGGDLYISNGASLVKFASSGAVSPSMNQLGLFWDFLGTAGKDHLVDRLTNLPFVNNGSLTFGSRGTASITIGQSTWTDTAHGMSANAGLTLSTTGALPTGFTAGVTYYVVSPTANGYGLALAPNGSAITASGSQSGVHTRRSALSALPGVAFNGSGMLQTDNVNFRSILDEIMRLDTVDTETMICVYGKILHGTSLGGTSTLFFYGRNATNGWGLQLYGGSNLCKARWYHVPTGGSQDQANINANFSLVGDVPPYNTKSAFAMTVTRLPSVGDQPNMGRGAGLFEIVLHMKGLTDLGQFGQQNSAVWHAARIPSGTSPASTTDTALTLGARPTTSALLANCADFMPSGSGLDMFGVLRRKRQQGFAAMVARQIAAMHVINPTMIVQPPCTVQ